MERRTDCRVGRAALFLDLSLFGPIPHRRCKSLWAGQAFAVLASVCPLYRGFYLRRLYPDAVRTLGSRAFSWGRRSALRTAPSADLARGHRLVCNRCVWASGPVPTRSSSQSCLGWFTAAALDSLASSFGIFSGFAVL